MLYMHMQWLNRQDSTLVERTRFAFSEAGFGGPPEGCALAAAALTSADFAAPALAAAFAAGFGTAPQ